jgi:cysteine desulfurase/selenocysteine lyase
LKLNPNSNIVIRGSTHEHPANHYPWVGASQRGELKFTPDETGYFELDYFKNTIDEKTGLVALNHVLFNTGAIIPVEEIGKILSGKNYHILLMLHKLWLMQ